MNYILDRITEGWYGVIGTIGYSKSEPIKEHKPNPSSLKIITRIEALDIANKILINAEEERIKFAEQEAKNSINWEG